MYLILTFLLSVSVLFSSSTTKLSDIAEPIPEPIPIVQERDVLIATEPIFVVPPEVTSETIVIDIPTDTYAKTYEDGKFITDTTSDSYTWIMQCSIDERGHYMYDDYYAVAMGNYFDEVGSKYIITLDNGTQFKVIKCDTKQDQHTINQMLDSAGAMIEFIIDTKQAGEHYGVGSNGYVMNGSFNNTDEFNGCIVSVEQIKE